jgi:RNA polymerase sigma-70 factor, ECF subfamily
MHWEAALGSASNVPDSSVSADFAHLPDEVLIMRLRDGDHDALTGLFDRYYRMVRSIAIRILRDVGEAEDLTQSVFLGILRSARQFDATRGTVKIWILQAAYNQAFNRRRYLTLRGVYSDWADPAVAERGCGYNGRSLDRPEMTQAVREALGELGRSQREVLEYAFYEGLTMREIAERTQKTFHSVRHDYYRALEKLRCILDDAPGVECSGAKN